MKMIAIQINQEEKIHKTIKQIQLTNKLQYNSYCSNQDSSSRYRTPYWYVPIIVLIHGSVWSETAYQYGMVWYGMVCPISDGNTNHGNNQTSLMKFLINERYSLIQISYEKIFFHLKTQ